MPRTDRLGITVSLVLLGLALSMLVQLPSRQFAFEVLGSELTVQFTGPTQLALIMTALVCAGVDAIMRSHLASPATAKRPKAQATPNSKTTRRVSRPQKCCCIRPVKV